MSVLWLVKPSVGLRVVVHQDLEHPLYYVKRGAMGTITFVNESRGLCCVKLDELLDGGELWDNEVYFNIAEAVKPHEEWYYLEQVTWPLPTRKGYY